MAKKKAVKKVAVKESPAITYSGQVTVSKVLKGKIISSKTVHNEGNRPLFEFLLNCLAGLYEETLRPYYITPILINDTKMAYATNSVLEPITSVRVLNSTSAESVIRVEYTFYLPYQPEYKDQGINGIALYCTKKLSDAKYVNKGVDINTDYSMIVSLGDTVKVEKEESLLVTWQLSINNN